MQETNIQPLTIVKIFFHDSHPETLYAFDGWRSFTTLLHLKSSFYWHQKNFPNDIKEFFENNIIMVKLSFHFFVRTWYTLAYDIILI